MNVQFIFLLQCLKKEIATAKELDLRLVGKVIIFRDKQTNRQLLLYIDGSANLCDRQTNRTFLLYIDTMYNKFRLVIGR